MKITHQTTDEQLYRWTKAELGDAIEDAGYERPRGNKEVYQNAAVAIRDAVHKEHEEDEARKAQQRMDTLSSERADQSVQKALQSVAEQVRKEADQKLRTLIDYQTEISGCISQMAQRLTRCEDIFFTSAYYHQKLKPLANYFEKQAESQDKTVAEIKQDLRRAIEEGTRRVMSDGYRHNCTCAVTNIENMQKFKAEQYGVAAHRAVLKLFEDLLDGQLAVLFIYIW